MLSGEQKFGSDSDNYNRYSFEQNVGSYLEGENLDITAKDINISGSTVAGKTAKIDAQNINVSSNVDKIETERRSKTKDFLKSNSKYEFNHSEENIAGNLLIEDKGEIYGDINLVGSNLSLGKNSYIDGKLNTDAKETFNKYIYEEKNKGISSSIGKNGISVSYGKTQYRYDEKDKTHIKSNVYLDDGTVLNKGANITATNFVHGDISINNGDVIYGARKDEKDVVVSSKSSSIGVSINVSSPLLDRAKQGKDTIGQIKSGDSLGGLVNIGNAITGTIEGLSGNQGNKQKANDGNERTKDEINNAKANNNFYVGINANIGYNKSTQTTISHTESAVVSAISGIDENSKITYNDTKNILYKGTQAENTTFVYNNVDSIRKEAVELNSYTKNQGSSVGIGVGANISLSPSLNKGTQGGNSAYGNNEVSLAVNASASTNKLKTEETLYKNGRFSNVDEIHNNTGEMILSGFNQEGGKVVGNISNVTIESLQNRSKTDGYTVGGNLSIGLTNTGAVSGNINGSLTDGNRNFVDNQTTFVIGEGSDLTIGKVDNRGSILGTTEDGKIKIDKYIGVDLENRDKYKTVGGSVGTSGVGINYTSTEREGVARNTVVGNVSIADTTNTNINYDISKANEISKDKSISTNIYAENQLINAVTNPEEFKKKVEVAGIEVDSLKGTVGKTVENIFTGDKSQDKGEPESRNLKEIKDMIIRTQTAPEVDLIAEVKDFNSKEVLEKLKIDGVERFDVNSAELPEKVRERVEELKSEDKELVSFYDKTTNKIFVSKDVETDDEIRALIAREWKISEDLKNCKGKANDIGEERATVAGEVAYTELKKRAEAGRTEAIDRTTLKDAVMDKDSEVTGDKYMEMIWAVNDAKYQAYSLTMPLGLQDIGPSYFYSNEKLEQDYRLQLLADSHLKYEEYGKLYEYGKNRPQYLSIEIPYLEKELSKEKDSEKKEMYTARLEYLKKEKKLEEEVGKKIKIVAIGAIEGIILDLAPVNLAKVYRVVVGADEVLGLIEERVGAKLILSEEKYDYLMENAPEYFYKNRHRIEINPLSKGNFTPQEERKILEELTEFYRMENPPDEYLLRAIGNNIGGSAKNKIAPKLSKWNEDGKFLNFLHPIKEKKKINSSAETTQSKPTFDIEDAKSKQNGGIVETSKAKTIRYDEKLTNSVGDIAEEVVVHKLESDSGFVELLRKSSNDYTASGTYIKHKSIQKNGIILNSYLDEADNKVLNRLIKLDNSPKNNVEKGILTEKLTNSIISKQEGIEIIHSKYGSNQGIDHAFIDKKTDILWIIDSKQMNKAGGFRVSNKAAGGQRQLSRKWIERVAENLDDKNPRESALIKSYLKSGRYQTGVVGVDKKTGEFILVPAKFKNKKNK